MIVCALFIWFGASIINMHWGLSIDSGNTETDSTSSRGKEKLHKVRPQPHKREEDKYHYVQLIDKITEPRDPNGPGENGRPVDTSATDEAKVRQSWNENYFNEIASNMMSVERYLGDYRPRECFNLKVSSHLPATSIIMTFCEESWFTLLRSVHSVMNRSPPEILTELILIDDFSQRDYLKKPLDDYMKRFPKVKIIRLKERHGLVRARMIGAELATSSVLTFLDSHIECTVGWLEPLLQRIMEDRRTVVSSVIDEINSWTFEYIRVQKSLIGSFTWAFAFKWAPVPDYEEKRRSSPASPIRSPTMPGGIFAIDKSFFYEIGAYDPGFDIWGGDNIDLSFRIWMCGGQLEFLPCSRVGHIFRSGLPFSFPQSNVKQTFHHNTLRTVEVWVDEPYKQAFFDNVPDMIGVDPGNLTDRRLLRKKLQCKDFQWYLDNVHPDMPKPDMKYRAKGMLKNRRFPDLCLTRLSERYLELLKCGDILRDQVFLFTWRNTIENDGSCLMVSKDVLLRDQCFPGSAFFEHQRGGSIMETVSKKCLAADEKTRRMSIQECNNKDNQQWTWQEYFKENGDPLMEEL